MQFRVHNHDLIPYIHFFPLQTLCDTLAVRRDAHSLLSLIAAYTSLLQTHIIFARARVIPLRNASYVLNVVRDNFIARESDVIFFIARPSHAGVTNIFYALTGIAMLS